MAYHVSYSPADGKIYAGTVNKKGNKWINKTEVTEEALAAVREHFLKIMSVQEDKPSVLGYKWETENGDNLILQLVVENKKE